MKVPPKRKGNFGLEADQHDEGALNESPSEKEGKSGKNATDKVTDGPSMKVPPKRKGNAGLRLRKRNHFQPSMKAPPKRKGDGGDPHRLPLSSRASMKVYTSRYRTNGPVVTRRGILICLIESPSKKEGK